MCGVNWDLFGSVGDMCYLVIFIGLLEDNGN